LAEIVFDEIVIGAGPAVENVTGRVVQGGLWVHAAVAAEGYRGRAKMIVDEDRRVVAGATLVGQAAGKLIHAFTIAIVVEVPLERLWHAIPCFPTMSEIWLQLMESYGM